MQANVHRYDDPFPIDRLSGKQRKQKNIPKTWGEAIKQRIERQDEMTGIQGWAREHPNGTLNAPAITGAFKKK